jgi:hypothetical protein
MNKCNGKARSNKSIVKIIDAKEELKSRNEKITQNKIAEITGLGIQTVKKYYWTEDIYDINSMIDEINNQYLDNSDVTINYNGGFTSTCTDGLFYEYGEDFKNTNGNIDAD